MFCMSSKVYLTEVVPVCYISIAFICDILKKGSRFCEMAPNYTLYLVCSYFYK